MATTTSITTTYAGEFAGKYVAAALLSAPTLDKGLIEIMPNVYYKSVIQKVSTDDILKDATCDFDPTSTVTLTERVLTLEEFQVNLQMCKKDFEQTWQAVEMGYSSFKNVPASFTDFIVAYAAERVAARIEQNIWSGVNASAGQFAGFQTLFAADGDVIDVTGTTVTASNVITELGKVVDAIPAALYGKEDLYLYVPQNVAKAYVRALGGFAASGVGANGVDNAGTTWFNNQELFFDGIKVAVANGLSSNKMVAAQKSNLFFGTGLLSDKNEVRLIDMADIDGSQNFRLIMRMSAGIQYGIGSDIVYYGA
jgi:hypothetical protein